MASGHLALYRVYEGIYILMLITCTEGKNYG